MDLNRKIEEIRQKPEHVRLRYVWGGVAVSMFFIVVIWVFSLNEATNKIAPAENGSLPDIKQSLEEIQSAKNDIPSISEINSTLESSQKTNAIENPENNLTNEGISPNQNITNSNNGQPSNPPSGELNKPLPPKQ